MRLTRTTHVALLVLCLFAGTGAAAQAADATADSAPGDQAGPPSNLPEPVPEFVTDILGTILQFFDGVLGGRLGPAVSGEAGNGLNATPSLSGG